MININEEGFSRFIKNNDYNTEDFIYKISREWWSRLYEYPWAGQFAESNDVCLDAACGTGHHLKYFLAEKCKKVYACDLDETLNNRESMFNEIKTAFGQEAYDRVMKNANKLEFKVCNLVNLPYGNRSFDKIYCISVLEHMSEIDREKAFIEFKRCLKDDGIMVITMDFPSVPLEGFKDMLDRVGLKFKYGYDFNIPTDCLVSNIYAGLKCFRAIIDKV